MVDPVRASLRHVHAVKQVQRPEYISRDPDGNDEYADLTGRAYENAGKNNPGYGAGGSQRAVHIIILILEISGQIRNDQRQYIEQQENTPAEKLVEGALHDTAKKIKRQHIKA